ncbi:MAG: methyltransferase domain-containing protein [Planctomycetota bacterium]
MQPASNTPARPPTLADGHTFYYAGSADPTGDQGVWNLEERLSDVEPHLELRPTDRVLDAGCAEGLITLTLAPRVREIHGLELLPARVERAAELARERGIDNAHFDVGSVAEAQPQAQSFDVVLLLGVIQHLDPAHRAPTLARMFDAAQRRLIVRAPFFRRPQLNLAGDLRQAFGSADEARCAIYPNLRERGGDLLVVDRIDAQGN